MIKLSLGTAAQAMGAHCPPEYSALTISGVCTDTRTLKAGDLYFALSGSRYDGHAFVREAQEAGAVACVCSRGFADGKVQNDGRTGGPLLLVDDPLRALGNLAGYYRREVIPASTRVIGVTGSNGKTTVKFMLEHVLQACMKGRASPKSFNNHVGVPLTLLSVEENDRYVVVELGTNAPGEIASLARIAAPDAAVITSVGEAHLERLGDIPSVAREKASLLDHLTDGGWVIAGAGYPELMGELQRRDVRDVLTVGVSPAADIRVRDVSISLAGTAFSLSGDAVFEECPSPCANRALDLLAEARSGGFDRRSFSRRGNDPQDSEPPVFARAAVPQRTRRQSTHDDSQNSHRISSDDFQAPLPHGRGAESLDAIRYGFNVPMPGAHQAVNAALVFAACRRMGVATEVIQERLRTFRPPPGRAVVERISGVNVVDDSYNANPASVLAAVEALRQAAPGRAVFVMGDMLELGRTEAWHHERVMRTLMRSGIEVIVAVGRASIAALCAFHGCVNGQVCACADSATAAGFLAELVLPGDTVWIKGSRGMGLETVADRLRRVRGPMAAVA